MDDDKVTTTTDEKVIPSDDKDVTDDELASSWDKIVAGDVEITEQPVSVKEETVEKVEVKETVQENKDEPPSPVTQEEKTWHGRFMKSQEQIAEMQAKLELLTQQKTSETETIPDEEDEDRYVTKKDVPTVLKELDEAGSKYETAYVAQIGKLARTPDGQMMDEKEFADIYEEMIAHYNIKRGDKYTPKSWNPSLDAELNWNKAAASLYKKKATTNQIPVRDNKVSEATGLTATSRVETPKKAIPRLDDAAMSVLKGSGLSDEEIADAINGNDNYFIHQRSVY